MIKLESECPYCGATMTRLRSTCPYCGSVNLWPEIVPSHSIRYDSSTEISSAHQVIEIDVKSDGVFSFTIRDGTPGNPWWWDLDLNGEQLYRISNGCGTCDAIFSRVRDAILPISPERLSKMLGDGLKLIPKEVVETVSVLLPEGTYLVGLLRIQPKKINHTDKPWYMGIPEYSWVGKDQKYEDQARYEVALPIVPENVLDQARIKYYESKINRSEEPTALALSVHMDKFPRGQFRTWSLSHILLDGHHKMMAASNISKHLTMLSFLYTGPTRPSLTLGPGEEDIRRYYAGGELRLGLLRDEVYDPVYDRHSFYGKAKLIPKKGFARVLAIILTVLLGGLVCYLLLSFVLNNL